MQKTAQKTANIEKMETNLKIASNGHNAKPIILCIMADFQTRLISRIFDVFSSGFLHRTTLNHL